MNSIIIDFEATGLSVEKDFITEIGATVVGPDFEELDKFSALVNQGSEVPEEAFRITGISTDLIRREGISLAEAFSKLSAMVESNDVQAAVAYNAQYDSKIFKNHAVLNLLLGMPGIKRLHDMDWLCAMQDLETNYQYKCWKLSHLCIDYGIAVDPSTLHRAMGDVFLTKQLLKASKKKVEDMQTFKDNPWVLSVAKIPAPWTDNGKGTTEAKKQGYNFEKCKGTEGPTFSKTWVKRIKDKWAQDEITRCSFKIEIHKEIKWDSPNGQ